MKKIGLIFYILFYSINYGQVGINTTSPNALLEVRTSDVNSPQNTDGLLIPKVNLFPSINPGASQDGMLVYLTTSQGSNLPGFYYWNNATLQWLPIGKNSGWSLSGNENIDDNLHFIGTTDEKTINFKVNNQIAGKLDWDITLGNSSLGLLTLSSNTTGIYNAAFGTYSLMNNTEGFNNSGFGLSSLRFNVVGNRNTAVGSSALRNNITGSSNTAVGVTALRNNEIGFLNVAMGDGALYSNISGSNMIAIGFDALRLHSFNNGGVAYTPGNIAVGNRALLNNQPTSLTNGNRNTAIGHEAMLQNTTGTGNTAIGFQNLLSNTTGFQNIGIGDVALVSNTIGSRNIGIGAGSLYSNTTATNNIGIGFDALRLQSFDNGGAAFNPANVAIGSRSLYNNQPTSLTNGNRNVAVGYETLRQNTTGAGNTAIGFQSILSNTTGIQNIGIGDVALASNTTGNGNVAIGVGALYENISGESNVGIGSNALRNNSNSGNVAIGHNSGDNIINGNNNTLIGNLTNTTITNLQYAVAIGSGAAVSTSNSIALGGNNATTRTRVGINNSSPLSDLDIRQSSGSGTNQGSGGINLGNGGFHWRIYNSSNLVRFNYSNDNGTTYTPLAYISATNGSWNQLSDATLKRDIKPIASVLEKMMKLNPVSYYYLHNSTKDKQSVGFLAQEVAQLFPESVSKDDNSDLYGIDYSSFAVYAVKAIQEQQETIEKQNTKIHSLEERLKQLEEKLNK